MRQEWLDFCRRVAADVEVALADLPTRDDREPVVGRGSGGDDTTVMDDRAEQAAVAQLEALHARGIDFRLVSEELGERTFGSGESPWVVIVDPIDGSLNAKRRLPFYCLSIAFAEGPTIADVKFGYVRDFGSGEEWVAEAGGGATVNGRPLALCQLADGRVDAVATLKPSRSVDLAAAWLIVREAGADVFLVDDPALPLDLESRTRATAARDREWSARLAELVYAGAP
jgi:myo-inositol-1(or 4)-monophosphatase